MAESKSGEARETRRSNKVENEDSGRSLVQEQFDQEQEQGYVGTKVDPTPDENYTLQGVASGAPTPETDEELAAEARRAAGFR